MMGKWKKKNKQAQVRLWVNGESLLFPLQWADGWNLIGISLHFWHERNGNLYKFGYCKYDIKRQFIYYAYYDYIYVCGSGCKHFCPYGGWFVINDAARVVSFESIDLQ